MVILNVNVNVLEENVRMMNVEKIEALKVLATKRADPRSALIIKQMCDKRINELKIADESMFREWVKAQ